eukprot:5110307-Pleurochrysis_carterae.AAC.1
MAATEAEAAAEEQVAAADASAAAGTRAAEAGAAATAVEAKVGMTASTMEANGAVGLKHEAHACERAALRRGVSSGSAAGGGGGGERACVSEGRAHAAERSVATEKEDGGTGVALDEGGHERA